MENKICTRCGEIKPANEFRYEGVKGKRCRTCRKDMQRWNNLARIYGCTEEMYMEMLQNQGGKCAICLSLEPGGRWGNFYVDHSHKTGGIRGLLCHRCNTALGLFDDDPESLMMAASYVCREKEKEGL